MRLNSDVISLVHKLSGLDSTIYTGKNTRKNSERTVNSVSRYISNSNTAEVGESRHLSKFAKI